MKYIVVCGPALSCDSIDITKYAAKLGNPVICSRLYFPEAHRSGDGVIERVNEAIKQGFPAIIYTRYFHTLQAFGEAVSDGRVEWEELLIVLHENIEGLEVITTHTMTSEGIMREGWPFGALG